MGKAKQAKAKAKRTKTAKEPAWTGAPEAVAYFRGAFGKHIGASSAKTSAKLTEVEAGLGFQVADELRELLARTSEVTTTFGEWRIDGSDVIVTDDRSNRFEQLLALDQHNYLGTALIEWMCGVVWVGFAGNGDVYFAAPDAQVHSRCPVWLFDHETFDFSHAIADSLSSLAWLNRLYQDVDADGVDTKAIAAGMKHIVDRVAPSWHYRHLVEVSGLAPEVKIEPKPRYYFARCAWILYLLRNDGVTGLERLPSLFNLVDHGSFDLGKSIADGWVTSYPVTALYWLWRAWFFGHTDDLAKVYAATAKSTSPIIRDAVALVRELEAGRTQLGTIEDIHALRAQFQALDLDPRRAEARAAERAAKKKTDAKQAKADRAVAEGLIAAGGDLVQVAWQHLDRPVIVAELYKHLRGDPSLALDFARYDFLDKQKWSRNGYIFDHEGREVAEALGATGHRLFPLLATRLEEHVLLEVFAHGSDPRLVPHLQALLSIREKYNHTLTAAVAAIAAAGASHVARTLIGFLREFAIDGFTSEVGNKDLLVETIRALARFRDPAAVPALIKLARETADGYEGVTPKAIKALGAIGDRRATPVLLGLLDGKYRDVAAYALVRLADPVALPVLRAKVERVVGEPAQTIYARTMLAALAAALGEPLDLAVAEAALDVVMDDKYLATELHETAVEMIGRGASAADAQRLIVPFLDAEQPSVRAAARVALAQRGVGVTPVYYDRAAADHLFAEGGAAALARGLADPDGVFKVNLLRKAVDTKSGNAVAAAAVPVARSITRFEHYTEGYVRDAYATIEYGVAAIVRLKVEATDDLVEEWLDHPNVLVREALDDELSNGSKRVQAYEDDERRSKPRKPASEALVLELAAASFGEVPFRFGKRINGVAFEPGGTRLAVVGDGRGSIFDASGTEVLRLDEVRGYAYDVDWHPDGASLAVGFHGGHLLTLDAKTGAILTRFKGHGGVPNGVRRVRFSADGKRLASVSDDNHFMLWDARSGKRLAKHEDKFDCNGVMFFADGRIAIGTDKAVSTFDAKGKREKTSDVGPIADLAVLPGGETFAAGGGKSGILVLGTKLNKVTTLKQGAIARLAMAPDGKTLVAASWEGADRGVSTWSITDKKPKRTRLPGHDDTAVWAMRVGDDGTIAAAGDKGFVVRWRADGTLLGEAAVGHNGEVGGLAIDAARDRLFSCADSLVQWTLSTRAQVRVFPRKQTYGLNNVGYSADGTTVFATGMEGCAAWDVATGAQKWHRKSQRSERLVVTDTALIAGDGDHLVWLDPATGELQQKSSSSDHTLYALAPITGGRLVTADFLSGHRLEIWDATTGARLPDVPLVIGSTHGTYCVTASRDGTRIYASCADGTIKVLDAASFEVLMEYRGTASRDRVAVSPSLARLAASADAELAIFDARTFAKLGELTLESDVESMVFVDDTRLVCGLESGGVVEVRWS